MQTPAATKSVDYARAIGELVAKMSVERAAQVYDFARFLQAQAARTSPLADEDSEDWLNDSEEQMQAEDASWDAACARDRDKFATLADAARAEITAGVTRPLVI